jgi:mannose-6-phosphate isomerase
MWHVLRAEPGAQVALGLRETITRERLLEASQTGEIEELLNWIPARAGDTFFVVAGTIHAIGAGLVMCEVQQLSDITYRLYDYGRPRPLHLDQSIAVSNPGPYEGHRDLPVECQYFHTERLTVAGRVLCPRPAHNTIYVALAGEGQIAGQPFRMGDAWEAEAGCEAFSIDSPDAVFLTTYAPEPAA